MIKKLLKSVREYRITAILPTIFVVLEAAMEVVIPLFMAFLIDNGINKGDMDAIFLNGAILVVLTLFSLLFGFLGGKYAAKASAGFAKNLRQDMYYKVQDFSFANIDKFSTASIVTRLTTDVTNIQNAFHMVLRVVRSPMMMICSFIMAMLISPKISIVFLVVMPLLLIGMYFIIRKAFPVFDRVFKKYDKLNNVVQENLHGIRVVKSFVREDFEKEKFGNSSKEVYKDFSLAERIVALSNPFVNLIAYGAIILVAWLGAQFVVVGSLTTGELVSLFTYGMQIINSAMMLSMIMVMMLISRASAKRVVEILDEDIDIKNPENPCYEISDGSVRFENVGFSYSKDKNKLCLMDINLEVKSGETVGIIGGTGSAKSSLIQLIARLYDTTAGELYIGGKNVKEYDIEALREQVAVVLQKNELFSGTLKENLRWGNKDATDQEIIAACKLAQADDFISQMPNGYDTYIEHGGSNVSGGQKQRICIARALLKNPKILILDDSTSAVDTKTDMLIRKSLKEDIPHITKFIIAQRISSVQDADKIVVMDNGRINAVGTHDELIKTNDIYKEVYVSQQQGGMGNE